MGISSSFKDAKSCLNDCGDSIFTNMITGTFRPFDYMCIQNYDGKIRKEGS